MNVSILEHFQLQNYEITFGLQRYYDIKNIIISHCTSYICYLMCKWLHVDYTMTTWTSLRKTYVAEFFIFPLPLSKNWLKIQLKIGKCSKQLKMVRRMYGNERMSMLLKSRHPQDIWQQLTFATIIDHILKEILFIIPTSRLM